MGRISLRSGSLPNSRFIHEAKANSSSNRTEWVVPGRCIIRYYYHYYYNYSYIISVIIINIVKDGYLRKMRVMTLLWFWLFHFFEWLFWSEHFHLSIEGPYTVSGTLQNSSSLDPLICPESRQNEMMNNKTSNINYAQYFQRVDCFRHKDFFFIWNPKDKNVFFKFQLTSFDISSVSFRICHCGIFTPTRSSASFRFAKLTKPSFANCNTK